MVVTFTKEEFEQIEVCAYQLKEMLTNLSENCANGHILGQKTVFIDGCIVVDIDIHNNCSFKAFTGKKRLGFTQFAVCRMVVGCSYYGVDWELQHVYSDFLSDVQKAEFVKRINTVVQSSR